MDARGASGLTANQTKEACAVIGIGASAGGVDALLQLLPLLTPGSAAFVIVVHLSHHADSQLAEVLGGVSQLPVCRVEATTPVEPGRVYVIPPLWDLELRGGALALETPGPVRPRRPIDVFFTSLARELGERAVGVVLTGAGSDGAAGAGAIKARGGTVLVQQPETAEFPSMPLAARAHADRCLRLEELGAALLALTLPAGSAAEAAGATAVPAPPQKHALVQPAPPDAPLDGPAAGEELRPTRVLVVDEDEPARALAYRVLTKAGYRVCTASDGVQGLTLLRQELPDLVLLGLSLKPLPGERLLEQMQDDTLLRRIPVVLTTDSTRPLSGAVDLLLKPFKAEELIATVGRHVGA